MSSLNTNSHFARQPSMVGNIPRSTFDRSCRNLTTFNASKLVPIFQDLILPGDTVTMDTRTLIRMATPITPVMDNAYCSIHFFSVPLRLVWEEFKYFMGENPSSAWAPVSYPTPPKILIGLNEDDDSKSNSSTYIGSVADYFNIPPTRTGDLEDGFYSSLGYGENSDAFTIDAFWFRAYTLIWNEWFRSTAIQDPAFCPLDSNNRSFSTDLDPLISAHTGGALLPVDKFFDYFTGALPDAQRGDPVGIPVSSNPWMPVVTKNENALQEVISQGFEHSSTLSWYGVDGIPNDVAFNVAAYGDETGKYASSTIYGDSPLEVGDRITPSNLFALGTTGAFGTINDLRLAFQLQRMLERDARGGSRLVELIYSHFGIRSPDARQQRPIYLGGKRFRIGMQQVAQTSSTDSVSPQGNLAAYSLTVDQSSMFTYSSTEWELLIGVCDVRTDHTYSYGIDRNFFIDDRYDVYWPALANIGELPIINREIFCYGQDRDEYFGYQEAWANYRYKMNQATAYFRPQVKESLAYWHYADKYTDTPRLSPSWIEETPDNIDRTLAVDSDVAHQFIADFQFDYRHTREMPVYSVPGLIDHN